MANARGKTVDKTYLSVDSAEDRGFIHRDYIAHCLRWTHVCKYLYGQNRYKSAQILDVGCGRELPLAKLLYSSRLIPVSYTGVDVGPINDDDFAKIKGEMEQVTTIHENTNFLDLVHTDVETTENVAGNIERSLPNIVTCFEVLEHVEPKMMIDMLEHMKRLTSNNATFFISTPCWNRTDCAANHVNEMLYESLGACFERHGFIVEDVYGTFASIRDYEHLLKHPIYGDMSLAFQALREYYDTNFLSCVFAPLFPAQSRNCLWVLKKRPNNVPTRYDAKFPAIEVIPTPWSSSTKWEDMKL